jgi:hypothetical protein
MRAWAIAVALVSYSGALVSPASAAPAAPAAPSVVILPGAPGASDLAMPFDVLDTVEKRAADQTARRGVVQAGLTAGLASVVMGAFALRMGGTASPRPMPEANVLQSAAAFSIASAVGTSVLASALAREAPAGLGARAVIGPGGGGIVVTGRF